MLEEQICNSWIDEGLNIILNTGASEKRAIIKTTINSNTVFRQIQYSN